MPTPVRSARAARARPRLISRRPDDSVGGGVRHPAVQACVGSGLHFEGLPAQVHPLEVKGGDQAATASA